jgi:hypothetical protein
LQPHRLRSFTRSRDPGFATKLTDVGLYVDPPAHALARSLDEKSEIQALDRAQPGLPVKPGRCQTMTHDYKRHGTTTPFAALSLLDGTVTDAECNASATANSSVFLMPSSAKSRSASFIDAVLNNYAMHKHPRLLALVARHPRWTFHLTPSSGSCLNAVEKFFSKMTRQRIPRGVFRLIAHLQAIVRVYFAEHKCQSQILCLDQIGRSHSGQTRPLPCTITQVQYIKPTFPGFPVVVRAGWTPWSSRATVNRAPGGRESIETTH